MKKTITVEVVKKDKTGFKATDGEWYSNKFKTFDVSKGQVLDIVLNEKGFLESTELRNAAPMTVGQEMRQDRIDEAVRMKQASVMISYAKDLAVAGIIGLEDIHKHAISLMELQKELVNPKKTEVKSVPIEDIKEEDLM